MEYKSNFFAVADRIAENLSEIKGSQKLRATIAQDLMVDNYVRVFEDGKAVNEQKIGRYSTKPMLIGASSFKNSGDASSFFSSHGKKKNRWKSVISRGQRRSLFLLPQGYKQLRRIQGLQTNFVNLSYTEKLKNSWRILSRGKVFTVGFTTYGAKLSRILEAKYGTQIWGVSKREQATANRTILNFVKNAL
jgi:hypothetical protein